MHETAEVELSKIPMKRLRLSRLAAVALTLMAAVAHANPFHLAPDGNDARDGTSRATAVATLNRAWELAAAQPAGTAATVLVHPGVYTGQWIRIQGSPPTAVTLRGVAGDGKRPVFEGGPNARETWLRLWASDGRPTGLTIEGLVIRGYYTAISLDGKRDDPSTGNEGTVIRDNLFERIGTIATNDPKALSTAAIRFVNSSRNTVERNRFVGIRNVSGCGALHALYLAHFSSRNRIVDNTVDDFCGSAVKLRDRSNDNMITGNVYRHAQAAPAIEEWFCDMRGRKGCTKQLGECPSTGNVDERNAIEESDGASPRVSIVGPKVPRPWCRSEDFRRERVITHD
ncbi:hypothetical protein [Caldimonas sp. KR1-144]|uniref:hypothetical protein n=1 Tax=Caldimonas sp. KR1-144 TaxID=3400911 RepID=UPI003C0818EB